MVTRPGPGGYRCTLVGGLGGLLVAVVVGYLAAMALNALLTSWVQLDGRYPTAGPWVVDGGVFLCCLLGAVLGVAAALRGRERARTTVVRVALLLPLADAVALAGVTALGRRVESATTPAVVMVEVAVVLAACALAVAVARWSALRRPSPWTSGAERGKASA